MKKYVVVVGLILVFLAVFIPFASSNPDGLERVAADFRGSGAAAVVEWVDRGLLGFGFWEPLFFEFGGWGFRGFDGFVGWFAAWEGVGAEEPCSSGNTIAHCRKSFLPESAVSPLNPKALWCGEKNA